MKLDNSTKTGVRERSGFDLSYDGVLSQSWGDIVPIVCKEMVPGDSFTCDASAFVRLAPLATPTYGRIHGYINYFFVPNRILLTDRLWEDFIRGGSTGKISYTLPWTTTYFLHSMIAVNPDSPSSRSARKICTYLGLPDPKIMTDSVPTGSSPTSAGVLLNWLPFAAYNRIYGDYFYPWGIDEQGDASAENLYFRRYGSNVVSPNFNLVKTHKACFKKDYYTTAQISPQRGGSVFSRVASASDISGQGGQYVNPDNVDSFQATGVSSLGIKWASALQKFLERNNIAGARYFEQILARFGVSIPAERLDRSEYLGGSDFYINVSDVTSTAGTSDVSLGDMAGKGVGIGQSGVSYHSKDYGFFIATLHLMPESGVVQGLNRMWTRKTRFDYFTPEFEETGMQPIYNMELWSELYLTRNANDFTPADSGVYGYIPRYAEYKYSAPLLAGDFRFRLADAESLLSFTDLDSMHLYRIFTNEDGNYPVLSPEFVTLSSDKAFNRIFQDTNDDFDHFWTNIQVKLGANRPMLGYIEASTAFVNDDKSGRVNIPTFGLRL